jgi:hypothetical protein
MQRPATTAAITGRIWLHLTGPLGCHACRVSTHAGQACGDAKVASTQEGGHHHEEGDQADDTGPTELDAHADAGAVAVLVVLSFPVGSLFSHMMEIAIHGVE